LPNRCWSAIRVTTRGISPSPTSCKVEAQIELSIDEIHPYGEQSAARGEREVRRHQGIDPHERPEKSADRYARPGEEHFIVEAGGNTRLRALRNCGPRHVIRAFTSWWYSSAVAIESHVLTSHLIEKRAAWRDDFLGQGLAASPH